MGEKISDLNVTFEVAGVDEVLKNIEEVKKSFERLDESIENIKAVLRE